MIELRHAAAVPEERGAVFGFAKPASRRAGRRATASSASTRTASTSSTTSRRPRPSVLARTALIEGTGECALDIGLVSLAPPAALAFLALGRTPLGGGHAPRRRSRGGRCASTSTSRCSTACLRGLSREAFWERVRAASALPRELAERVYDAFHPFGLGGMVTRSTVFEHVGSLAELPEAGRSLLAQGIKPFYEPEVGEIRPLEAPDRIVHDSAAVDLRVTGGSPGARRGLLLVPPRARGRQRGRRPRRPDAAVRAAPGLRPRRARAAGGPVVVVLSSRDSLKAESDPARLVVLRPAARRVARGARARARRRLLARRPGRPLRRAPLLPRPDARAAARVRGAARRRVDGGVPRRAPPVARRDPGPGRRRAPRGAARRAPARVAARALPRRDGAGAT